MLFEKNPPLNIMTCPTCKSTGRAGWKKCPECGGMALGHAARNKWLFWDYPLVRHHLLLEKGRRVLNRIRVLTALCAGVVAWLGAGLEIYKQYKKLPFNLFSPAEWLDTLAGLNVPGKFLFWLGLAAFCYVWYRSIRHGEFMGQVEKFDYNMDSSSRAGMTVTPANWREARKLARVKKRNIAKAFTEEALKILGEAYFFADRNGQREVAPAHLFAALLTSNRISNVFSRLGLPAEQVLKKLTPILQAQSKSQDHFTMPLPSADFCQALFVAYEEAYNGHQEYVSVTELLAAAVKQTPEIQELLFDLNVNHQKLANVIEWARIREKLYRQYLRLRRAASHHSKHGMDKAMTAIATPYLNQFSEDMTMLAHFGHLDECVARETETQEIFRVIEGGQANVLLVGDFGTGKSSIVEGIAGRMLTDDVPARLRDKRLVRLSVPSLLAGTTPAGAVERLRNIMNEMARARNIILYIHNLHELIGVSAGTGKGSLDVADTLAEFLGGGRFLTIADTTDEFFAQLVASTAIANVFTKVEIPEVDENQAIQVLESKAGQLEYKHNVFFSYDALERAVQLSAKFLHDTRLPGSALEVMTEAASLTRSKKGENTLVTGEEVAKVISEKSKVPVTTVTSDESAKLLQLEEEMHKRVIGQDEAVNLVANALRRARAEIRSGKRPIANFLFMGPTGVGKTELAKTIAEVYFGGEERMIRLDMSEFQEGGSIYRMIGTPGQKGTGILTEAVRSHPFSLLLLDEIEKADKDVLNLFLQVMDDGRLTDSTGRVVDFTNVILIATSNAGTSYVQEQMRAGLSSEAIKERLLHGELNNYFRPEFLNRFDGIVLFKALEREDIKKIAGLMLARIGKNLEEKGIELEVGDPALEFLAHIGFDPEFGARPMRRALQERVENKLAELLLGGKLKRKDKVVIGEGGEITVK
ncbi:ATP-dependent Clp protease ATP-binding subunit [Patescibacteria group bacterium]|nr:MAG: ATP-dependent Clp protease ATP-binding subunit [Patescibacteria group bacterium]